MSHQTAWNREVSSWAHFLLAISARRRQREFVQGGIKLAILVDADIIISQTNPSQQRSLFRDLLNEKERPYYLSLIEFFYEWILENFSGDPSSDVVWAVSPEHFREIVVYANGCLEDSSSSDDADSSRDEDQAAILAKLSGMLETLNANPWADIDNDLVPLLALLGVTSAGVAPPQAAAILQRWLDRIVVKRCVAGDRQNKGSLLESVGWPKFESSYEGKVFRAWRERLWNSRHGVANEATESPRSSKTIDADARTLAALTLLNEGWAKKGVRVHFLTGSPYVLRAVAGQALDPLSKQAHSIFNASDRMSDFLLMPSSMASANAIWQPLTDEAAFDTGGILEWSSSVSDRLSQRRAWFILANSPRDARAKSEPSTPTSKRLRVLNLDRDATVVKPNSLRSIRKFFSSKVSESTALAQVRARLADRIRSEAKFAMTLANSAQTLDDLRQKLSELTELRRVRLRVDMLEHLIHAYHFTAGYGFPEDEVDALRGPPYVEFGNLEFVRELSANLSKQDGRSTSRVQILKAKVFEEDPSTYYLVLAYASAYAQQRRWPLAASAAQYAYVISKTRDYVNTRPGTVGGEEAKLLEIACRRRRARVHDDIRGAMESLDEFERISHDLPDATQLLRLRIGIERSSLELTDLLSQFFAEHRQPDEAERHFKKRASYALRDAMKLSDSLSDTDGELNLLFESAEMRRYLSNRVWSNCCNLAWLTVAWSPAELSRSTVLTSKRGVLALRHDAATEETIEMCLRSLWLELAPAGDGWDASRITHTHLTVATTAMIVAPDLVGLRSSGRMQDLAHAFARWRAETYQHPYDSKWIDYAARLSERLRP